jgi:hypothetical protein
VSGNKTKEVRKLKKRFLSLLAMALFIAFAGELLSATVIFDPDEAVHVEPRGIEEATLAIGTHLIYVGALTNYLYDIAMESAVASGQDNIYYKSELAGGAWFDITSASTMADITTGGIPVFDDDIRALLFTHHTKSDGITYDLRTGLPVSVFNIRTPYDLESMPDLFPLKIQLDMAVGKRDDNNNGEDIAGLLEAFFQTEVTNEVTAACDKTIDALQSYLDILRQYGGGAAETEAVQEVMRTVDAVRRFEVTLILEDALNTLAETLFDRDAGLRDAVSGSLSNILDSQIEHGGNMLAEGVTVLSKARYDASVGLIDAAAAGNHTLCDRYVAELIALGNIQNNRIGNQNLEFELLDAQLIPASLSLFRPALRAGENAEYRKAAEENAAAALRNSLVRNYKNELSVIRGELEFFIDAKSERMLTADAMEYVNGRLAATRRFPDEVPNDGFSAAANESIGAHIDFLTRLFRKLELKAGGNDADKLAAEKAGFQQDLLEALDNNDLMKAKEIEVKISEIDGLMALTGQAGGPALAGTVADLLSEARSNITGGGDEDDLLGGIDALGALLGSNYGMVFPALETLYGDMVRKRDLEGDKSFTEAIEKLENILLENTAAFNASQLQALSPEAALAISGSFFEGGGSGIGLFDSTGGPESGSGRPSAAGTGGGTSGPGSDGTGGGSGGPDGRGFGGGSDASALSRQEQQAVLAMSLSMYREETGSDSLDGLLRATVQQQAGLGNLMMFAAIQDSASRYLPAPSVAWYLNMRYVWSQNQSRASLARGGVYYSFTVYSEEVVIGREKSDVLYMPYPARYMNSLHIPDSFTYEAFGVWAVYIPGTQYGVLMSETLYELSAQLFAEYLRGGYRG